MSTLSKSLCVPQEIGQDVWNVFRARDTLTACEGMSKDSYTGFRDGAYELTYGELEEYVKTKKHDVEMFVYHYNLAQRCAAINGHLGDDFTRKDVLRNVVCTLITPCCIRINWNAKDFTEACLRLTDTIRINDANALCLALEKDFDFDSVNHAVVSLYNAVMKKAANEARGAKDQETGMKAAIESLHEVFGIFLRKSDIRMLCNKVAELEKARFNKEGFIVSNALKRVTMQDFEAVLLQVLRNAFYSDSYQVKAPNGKSVTFNKSMILKAIGKDIAKPEEQKPEEQKPEEQKPEEQKPEEQKAE